MKCSSVGCETEVTTQGSELCIPCGKKRLEQFEKMAGIERDRKGARVYQCGICSNPASAAQGKNTVVIHQGYSNSYLRCNDCEQTISRRCPQCNRSETRKLSEIVNYKIRPEQVPCKLCKRLVLKEEILANPEKVLSEYRPGTKFKTKQPIVYEIMEDIPPAVDGWSKRRDVKFQVNGDNQLDEGVQVKRTVIINKFDGRISRDTTPRGRFMGRGWVTGYYRSWQTLLADYEEYITKKSKKKYKIIRIEIDRWKKEKKVQTESGSRTDFVYNYPVVIHYHLYSQT